MGDSGDARLIVAYTVAHDLPYPFLPESFDWFYNHRPVSPFRKGRQSLYLTGAGERADNMGCRLGSSQRERIGRGTTPRLVDGLL